MNELVIGIIGGMGPKATVDLYKRIIDITDATCDQDYFHVIIDANSKIPDRTQVILNNGESAVPEMIRSAKKLEKMQVDIGCIACITAHNFIQEVQETVNYRLLNMLELVKIYIQGLKGIRKIGVLATEGTIASKLFETYLTEYEVIYPSEENQKKWVTEAIYGTEGIKKSKNKAYPKELLIKASQALLAREADLIIAGCTEIGIVLKEEDLPDRLIDPVSILVNEFVKIEKNA